MSWSVSAVGEPEAVVRHLERYMADQSPNQSKEEYDAAKPHLVALLRQNFATEKASEWAKGQLVSIDASGSGTKVNGEDVQRNCSVTLRTIGKLVT